MKILPHEKVLGVLGGGGMPGLDILAGILLGLEKRNVRFTHVIGTSAGAIIAALDAAGYSARKIADTIERLNDDDIRQPRPFWKMRPWIDYIFEHDRIWDLLADLLPHDFTDLVKPLGVHTTRNRDGAGVTFGHIRLTPTMPEWHVPLRDAVLASMSIHGFFQEVVIGGDLYTDGGTTANVPIPYDLSEYDHIVICIPFPPTEYRKRKMLFTRMVQNVQYLMRGQIDATLERIKGDPRITVIWPKVPKDGSTMRFDHSLIYTAEAWTLRQLNEVDADN